MPRSGGGTSELIAPPSKGLGEALKAGVDGSSCLAC